MEISSTSFQPSSLTDPSRLGVISLKDFLNSQEMEGILKDPLQGAKILKQLQEINFSELPPGIIESFLINNFLLTADIENAMRTSPHTLHFFLIFVAQMLKKEAYPWTFIQGKTFLAHLQDHASKFPPELGIFDYLMALGQDSLKIFEEVITERSKANLMGDNEEKIKKLVEILEKSKKLADNRFPNVGQFIEKLEKEIEQAKASLEIAQDIAMKLEDPVLSKKEKIKSVKEINYNLQEILLAYLIRRDNFESISLFLQARSFKNWHQNGFKEVCLEKTRNIAGGMLGITAQESSEMVAVAWNHYYSSACIFRDKDLFSLEQIEVLDDLIREKVIKRLFLYMLTTTEYAHEYRYRSNHPPESLAIPLSLHRIKKQESAFVPLVLPSHNLGLLIEPVKEDSEEVMATIYNTGWGLLNNHPVSADYLKYQTYVQMKIPSAELFNEGIWRAIRQLHDVPDPDRLYTLFKSFGSCKQESPSDHPSDFNHPQFTGTCVFQHMIAMIRHDFMKCEALGTKEMRAAAYRLVISDFSNFWGQNRFPIEEREQVLANQHDKKEIKLLEAWQDKELKLQAILNVAKSFNRHEQEGNILEYCSQQFTLAKSPHIPLEPATKALKETVSTYWKNQQKRVIEALEEMDLDDLPRKAASCYLYSRRREELSSVIQNRLAGHEDLMAAFKQRLDSYRITWITE